MASPLRIIGIPMDLGQSLRGVDMGPSALRYAGLIPQLTHLGYTIEDRGNVPVAGKGPLLNTMTGVALAPLIQTACQHAYDEGRQAIAEGFLPIFLGGDHAISIGTIGGATHDHRSGVLWIDAHGDFNTPETSPSGNIHGMPLATLCGYGLPELIDLGRPGPKIDPRDVVIIALRDLDALERTMLRQTDIGIYTMREIDERGIAPVVHEALQRLGHCDRLHVSLDMDSLDPMYAPGVGTPVDGGLTFREAHLLMEIISDDRRVSSIDIVEINPILDEKNRTAQTAVQLLTSLLGRSIL